MVLFPYLLVSSSRFCIEICVWQMEIFPFYSHISMNNIDKRFTDKNLICLCSDKIIEENIRKYFDFVLFFVFRENIASLTTNFTLASLFYLRKTKLFFSYFLRANIYVIQDVNKKL